jgi:excisionase family DNA binding protein
MRLISVKGVALILECSERKIRYMIESGALRATRMGKRAYRIREDEVERAKASPMIRPNPDKARLRRQEILSRSDLKIQCLYVYWSGTATDEDATMLHAAVEHICDNLAQTTGTFFFCRKVAQIRSRSFVPAPMEKSS